MPKIQNQIKFYKYITNAGVFASALLTLLTLNILIPINFKSETAVATDALTSTTSLTLDVASSAAGVELLVTSESGTFASTPSGSEMSFDVTTTNSSGYTLSLKSKTGSTDLTNIVSGSSGNDETIGTFSTITSTSGISADTFSNSDNTAYNNHWGIKPSYYESVANSDGLYYPSPDSTGIVLNATDSANVSGSADTYIIAIGARATYAQPAGTYSNNYILSAVGNYPRQATCTKQYRLQNADGSFPTTYTLDTTEELDIGTTCTYTKSVSDYKYGGASATNGASGTTSGNVTEDGATLSLDFYRNTYALTVSAGSNISSVSGSGTYRWGQSIAVSATKSTSTDTCITYNTPTWSRTAGVGTLNSTSGTSVTFTMSTGTATVQATSSSSRKTYTITYNNNGGSGTMSNTTGSCGAATTLRTNTFTRSGYNFLGWATSSSATSVAYTDGQDITISQTSTLKLYAVWEKVKLYMWNATSVDCGETMYDNRDGTERTYTTMSVTVNDNALCWMTVNLALGADVEVQLTSDTSNVDGTYTLPVSGTYGFNYEYSDQRLHNAGFQACSETQPCYGYYTYAAATAGKNPDYSVSSYDICPANWRLPTVAEYNALISVYDTVSSLMIFWRGVYSGYYTSGFASGGWNAEYWTSNPYGYSVAYVLSISKSPSAKPYTTTNTKSYGLSIRCVMKT